MDSIQVSCRTIVLVRESVARGRDHTNFRCMRVSGAASTIRITHDCDSLDSKLKSRSVIINVLKTGYLFRIDPVCSSVRMRAHPAMNCKCSLHAGHARARARLFAVSVACAAMVLDLRCIRPRRFARARPRAAPRGASNLGISSLVPGIGAYRYVSTEIASGTVPTENSVETYQ